MTNARPAPTPAGMLYQDGQTGDYSGGFVSGIRRITLISESTVMDLLSLAILDEEKASIIGDMWAAGLDQAGDPETDFDVSQILKMKWSDIAGSKGKSLPWATTWALKELALSLSIGGGPNFYRIQHMHTGYDSVTDAPTGETGKRRRRRRSNNSSDVAA